MLKLIMYRLIQTSSTLLFLLLSLIGISVGYSMAFIRLTMLSAWHLRTPIYFHVNSSGI